VSPGGDWNVVGQYDGQPNGLKIHRDGRVFIADFLNGIMELDPVNGRIEPFLARDRFPGFKGFNDLFFAANGDPNGAGLPPWPAYTRDSEAHLVLGPTVEAGSELRTVQLDFWDRRLRAGMP